MKKHIFISGIDTDCGKTYITGILAKNLKNLGLKCITSKFVQTGCKGIAEDIFEHRKTMGTNLLPEDLDGTTCPFVYNFPASPHLSANIDKRFFDIDKVKQAISKLKSKYDIVLTEGAGGLTVPLTNNFLTSDYLKESGVPVILVSSSKLGSLNHTILSIEFCKSNNINLIAIVYNQFPNDDSTIAKDSYWFIKNYLKEKHPAIKLINSKGLLNKYLTIEIVE
jgi:dethiobiotin synthetase